MAVRGRPDGRRVRPGAGGAAPRVDRPAHARRLRQPITSPTARIVPVEEIVAAARDAEVLSIVDGAHAPGQLALDLDALGADVYAGNCHKWMCAPKGAGFLSVREDVRDLLEPTVVSWDWEDGESFAERHRWQGTRDPSPYLAVPAAIDFMDDHDWPSHQARCRALAAQARDELAELFGLEPLPGPIAQMAAARVPPCDPVEANRRLLAEHRVEAPFTELHGDCLIRASFQAYNDEDDLERLIVALGPLRGAVRRELLFHLPKERFRLAVRCHRETTSARLRICGRRCGDSTGEMRRSRVGMG